MSPGEASARLAEAAWLYDPDLHRVLEVLGGKLRRTRAVGGLVRDTLLGRSRNISDLDLATELLPEEVRTLAAAGGIASYPTGIEHGTVTLRCNALTVEVTTLREDVETDGRHARVRFGTDWHRDAERRDFTMNALYAEMDGALFDPLGGLSDCLDGRVRFIGDPDRRLREDRLRVFRFFRFSASHGRERFDPEGLAACARSAAELGELSAERIGGEMLRLLQAPAVARTLGAMLKIGVLGQPLDTALYARYEALAEEPLALARLALLLSERSAAAVQRDWRLSNATVRTAEDILAAAMLLLAGKGNEAAYRYRDQLVPALPVAGALGSWSPTELAIVWERVVAVAPPPFPLSGGDLIALGHKPGPELGRELERLKSVWLESDFAMDRAALLALARSP